MQLPTDLRVLRLLADSRWEIDPDPYVMVGTDPGDGALAQFLGERGFRALIIDDLEATLFVAKSAWERAGITGETTADASASYSVTEVRLLTFPAALPPDLVGFLATVAVALADAGVPILPLAANRRDHVFVPADTVKTAEEALLRLAAEASRLVG